MPNRMESERDLSRLSIPNARRQHGYTTILFEDQPLVPLLQTTDIPAMRLPEHSNFNN